MTTTAADGDGANVAESIQDDTLYSQVGGLPVFETLVTRFYDRVQRDEVLWPMYPQEDLEGAIWRLANFLAQYFGGPTTYSELRGHPRLRMRHMPFHVNPDARERWFAHMSAAVESLELAPMHRAVMLDYFDRAATAMVNTFEPTPTVADAGGRSSASGGADAGVLPPPGGLRLGPTRMADR